MANKSCKVVVRNGSYEQTYLCDEVGRVNREEIVLKGGVYEIDYSETPAKLLLEMVKWGV